VAHANNPLPHQAELADRFPADFFPAKLEAFRMSISNATKAPNEYAAVAMLAAASAAIGNAVVGLVKAGWSVPASLFLLIVGYKGSGKSPTFEKVFPPLYEREEDLQRAAIEEDAADIHQDDDDDGGDQEKRPRSRRNRAQSLITPCIVLNDATTAAVMQRLAENPHGLLLNYDELSTLFIKAGKGADRQALCELYECRRRSVHRKSDRSGASLISRTFATLVGGIQPDLLEATKSKRGEDGLMDRFLMVGMPGARLPEWADESEDMELSADWAIAVKALFEIEPPQGQERAQQPIELRFDAGAFDSLRAFHRRLCEVFVSLRIGEQHYGLVNKFVANAARLALIRRCLRWSSGEFGLYGPLGLVDESDCEVACQAAEFFLSRMLAWRPELFDGGTNTVRQAKPLEDAIRDFIGREMREDGRMTIREIQMMKLRPGLKADDIRAAFNRLVDRGEGKWIGPRQTIFSLHVNNETEKASGQPNNDTGVPTT